MSAFGSDDPTVDSKTRFYFGSSGWSGSLAEDANVKRMYHVLNRTCDFAVDQISFFSESGQTLGDVEVESIAVVSDGDLTDDNIQETTGKHR
ncbi:MAG: hypothetical protein GWO26_21235, partial [Phycisphaerae bacterium]|nr:hypothetical protein [Phycisphaerae bacterium]